MTIKTACLLLGLAICLLAKVVAQPALATDYARSLSLPDEWRLLTRDAVLFTQWVGDSDDFIYLKSVDGGFRFIRENAETGLRAPAFDHERLAAGLGRALGEELGALDLPFNAFKYEQDQEAISFLMEGKSWLCALTDYSCAIRPFAGRPKGFDVVRDLRIPADNEPRRSPDGKWLAFVQDDNIAIRPTAGGAPVLLSIDGSPGDFYDPETIKWSPDSTKLAAFRVRPGYARYITRVNATPEGKLHAETVVQLYPKPGDRVDIERPVLFHVDDRKQIEIDDDLIRNPYRLRNLEWRKDSQTFAFEYTRRGHQQARLVEVDARSGEARAVITENADTFIDHYRSFRHNVNGENKEIIWLSERDGWRHLYLYDGRTGRVKNRITKGDWVVRSVLAVDEEKRRIWFTASGRNDNEDPYFTHFYRINFDGSDLTSLTEPGASHEIALSGDHEHYVVTTSRVDLPPVTELRRTIDRSIVRVIAEADISRLEAAGFRPPESFVAKGRDGGTDIWGLIYRPRDFDPAKRYPVIEEIYAGPQGSYVQKTFWPFGRPGRTGRGVARQALADLGFIVVQMDGMGTANRSKSFHDVAWKNLHDAGFPDRVLWHEAVAAHYPWYDISRGVGVYGGSAGGQNALGALLFHSDFYAAAVASVGCYDNRLDKIWWSEQWLGWPVDESYISASGIEHASRLQGDLFIIYGDQDDNVDPANSVKLIDALIEANKDFEMLVVPGMGHGFGRDRKRERYVERRRYDFFIRKIMH